MTFYNTYEAFVMVARQRLPEYEPPEHEDNDADVNATTYVEVVEGAEFKIEVVMDHATEWPTNTKTVWMYIDGQCTEGLVVRKDRISTPWLREPQAGWTASLSGIRYRDGDEWFTRPYVFKNLSTTDTAMNVREIQKVAQKVGTIQVEVYNVNTTGRSTSAWKDISLGEEPVPEKALKGQPIDITAGLGTKMSCSSVNSVNTDKIGKAQAVFKFKYRSRKALQMLDLIPASPDPEALADRDVNTLNLTEARRLLSQYQQRERRATPVKKESKKMKREVIDFESPSTTKDSEAGSRKRVVDTDDLDDDDCKIVSVKKRRRDREENVEVLDLS